MGVAVVGQHHAHRDGLAHLGAFLRSLCFDNLQVWRTQSERHNEFVRVEVISGPLWAVVVIAAGFGITVEAGHLQADVAGGEGRVGADVHGGDHANGRVRVHLRHAPGVRVLEVDAAVFGEGAGGALEDLTGHGGEQVGTNLFDLHPLHAPRRQGAHAGHGVPQHIIAVAVARVVVQAWGIRDVAVVGDVHLKGNHATRSGGLDRVVDPWVHRNPHVVEFVDLDVEDQRVAEARFTALVVGVGLFGEGFEDHGVGTCFDLIGDVHSDLEGLVGVTRQLLQGVSRHIDVPKHVNAGRIRHASQAEVVAVWTVAFVAHGDGQEPLLTGVHEQFRAHIGIDACFQVIHVDDVGRQEHRVRNARIRVQVGLQGHRWAEAGRGVGGCADLHVDRVGHRFVATKDFPRARVVQSQSVAAWRVTEVDLHGPVLRAPGREVDLSRSSLRSAGRGEHQVSGIEVLRHRHGIFRALSGENALEAVDFGVLKHNVACRTDRHEDLQFEDVVGALLHRLDRFAGRPSLQVNDEQTWVLGRRNAHFEVLRDGLTGVKLHRRREVDLPSEGQNPLGLALKGRRIPEVEAVEHVPCVGDRDREDGRLALLDVRDAVRSLEVDAVNHVHLGQRDQ